MPRSGRTVSAPEDAGSARRLELLLRHLGGAYLALSLEGPGGPAQGRLWELGPPPGPPAAIRAALDGDAAALPGAVLTANLEAGGALLGRLLVQRAGPAAPFSAAEAYLVELAAEREALALSPAAPGAEGLAEAALAALPSSLVLIDRSLRVAAANRTFLERSRRQRRDTIGRPISAVLPAPLVRFTRLEQRIQAVFQTSQPHSGDQLLYRAPSLPARTYAYRLLPVPGPRRVDHVALLMEDISERERLDEEGRLAERHMASAVEFASDLVASLDLRGQILTWNPAAERISGRAAAEVRGLALADLCSPDQRPALAGLIARLAAGEELRDIEASLLPAGGREPLPIAWSGAPMRDGAGQPIGLVVFGRDLTERRRLELELIQSAKMASLGVMAGGIAHEIRNPLSIVSAGAQLMQELPCAEPLHADAAARVYRAAQRAATIIEDLLTFAQPDRSRRSAVDLNRLIGEALAQLAGMPAAARIRASAELDPALPTITGSPGLLQQVLTNLISNACQAMPEGGELRLRSRRDEGAIELVVEDTGRGIPVAIQPRIFDPFFTTGPAGRGIGLGLAISYRIIQQHQGTISVVSQLGQGSRFTIRLPLG